MLKKSAIFVALILAVGCSEQPDPGGTFNDFKSPEVWLSSVRQPAEAALDGQVRNDAGIFNVDETAASEPTAIRAGAPMETCVLPRGDKGITYGGTDIPEMAAWGPAALSISPDGHFWIADTAGLRLLEFDANCALKRTVELPTVVGAGDVEVTENGLHVLDAAAQDPAVVVFSADGREISRLRLTEGESATGLTSDARGAVLVEHGFGEALEEVIDEAGWTSEKWFNYHNVNGELLSAQPADMSREDAGGGFIRLGSRSIAVEVEHQLGGLRYLGAAPDGSFYIMAEEVALERDLVVDRTVRHYNVKGRLLGVARVPLAEQFTHVEHGVAVAPDGTVYALLTREDHAEIVRLQFAEKLESIFTGAQPATSGDADDADLFAPPVTCISRTTIMNTAWAIRDNQKYLSSTNTSGTCSGRGKPRYIGSAGTYRSIAYDWGGFSSLSQYNAAMSPGTGKAGDINTAAVESCSYGLDCSGFVSRAWQKTTKYGTATLSQVSWQMSSTSSLLRGDAMNKSGSHVVLFESFTTGGIWTLEATTTNSYDRVVYITRSWSALSGYVPRRLNSVCN